MASRNHRTEPRTEPRSGHRTGLRGAHEHAAHRTPVLVGIAFGLAQAAAPLVIWWLTPSAVQSILLVLIAAIYIGFAVADGRPKVIAAESAVVAAFLTLAVAAVTSTAWLLVVGYAAHGAKDYWQHRTHFVRGIRWWPPYCAAVDITLAIVLTIQILAGVRFGS